MPSLLRTVLVCAGVSAASAFAPGITTRATRSLGLRMQIATPPPPLPVSPPQHEQLAVDSGSASVLAGHFDQQIGLSDAIMLAHGGGEGHGGADIPYKLMKVRDNKNLHMSEEEKMEWEKKLTGEAKTEKEKQVEQIVGAGKLAVIWVPMAYYGNMLRKMNKQNNGDKIQTVYNLIFLTSVPLAIVLSGWVYPDPEWEKLHEILTWFLIWSPAVAINALTQALDALRQESSGKELAERR